MLCVSRQCYSVKFDKLRLLFLRGENPNNKVFIKYYNSI